VTRGARGRIVVSGSGLSGLVVFVVLVGALLHASWNALLKAQPDHVRAAGLVMVGAAIAALPLLFVLPLPAPASWAYIAVSALIHIGYFLLVGYAYRGADLSVAYPLTRGSAPLFTAMLALLLVGEDLRFTGWLAVVLIASGIMTLSADALLRGGLTGRTATTALVNAGVIVTYTLVDAVGARAAGNGVAYTAWMMAMTGSSVAMLMLAVAGRRWISKARVSWRTALLAGTLTLVSYGIALWAMTEAPIGLVAALRETSVLFAALMGAYFFGERFGPWRWSAVALILGGIGLLRLPV
jgi:drug/metabolite transporter (DMT)-like permease